MNQFKAGDYVLVHGESDEVFLVEDISNIRNVLFLSNGATEPMKKCRKIPEELHKYVWREVRLKLEPTGLDNMPV